MITHVNVGIDGFDFEDCYNFIKKLNTNKIELENHNGLCDMHMAVLTYICEKFCYGVNISMSSKDMLKVYKILKDLGLENAV